jgi:sulfur relay (sulfurtransferase) DsrC/TusE family protein
MTWSVPLVCQLARMMASTSTSRLSQRSLDLVELCNAFFIHYCAAPTPPSIIAITRSAGTYPTCFSQSAACSTCGRGHG